MKFEEIYIDGFGIFHDYPLKNLTPGLTIFVGPNEAGKSTILSFQKRILFGFPHRSSKLNPYPPLAGGNHGGRIIASSSDNKRHIIERYASANDAKVILPDGSTAGETELSKLIGHANKDIFENIYAFGLSELQDFETLNNEAVKGRMYSAGTGIGAVSLSEIQNNLGMGASALFRPRGKKQEINVLFSDLKRIDSRLREIEEDTQKFDTLHQKLEELTSNIKECENKRNEISEKLDHTKNLITVWDDWRTIQEAKDRLKDVPKIENFPEKGLDLLDKYRGKIDELKGNISENNESLEDINSKKSILKIDENLLKNKDNILELQKGQGKYISAVSDLPKSEKDLKIEEEELNKSLKEIGPDWDEEKLSNFDISIPSKEKVRNQHNTLQKVKQVIHEAQNELKNIDQSIEETKGEGKKIERQLEEQSLTKIDEKELKEERAALQRLRIKYPSLNVKEAEMHNLEENENLIAILKPHHVDYISETPSWPAFIFIAAGIASMILSILGDNWIVGIGIFTILLISAVIYIIFTRKKIPITEQKEIEAEDLTKRSRDLSEKMTNLEHELQEIKTEMLSDAKVCDFESIPDPQIIERKDTELQIASEGRVKINEWMSKKASLYLKLEELTDKKDALSEKLEDFKEKEKKIQKKWEDWLTDRGLNSELTPEGAIDSFAMIKTCMEKKISIEKTQDRINTIKGFIKEYKSKIFSVLRGCNRKSEDITVVVELEKLTEDLDESLQDKTNLEHLNKEEENINSKTMGLQKKLTDVHKKYDELISQGCAESEVEFRENAKNWEERNNLMGEIFQGEHNIKRISGDESYSNFINELQETSLEVLKGEESQLKESLEAIDGTLSEMREQSGGVAKEIEQIERMDEGSSLRIEKNAKIQKLREKADEWSVLTVAKTILEKAIKRYERERQPGVIKEAQSFFSKMTLGRYPQIFAPLDEAKIYVIDRDGHQKEIQDLSRGTAEQLYLSLRFGFIREFSKRSESLPIVFDDILVNFDPKRFKAACEGIKELSETNQVLYFTCHPETVDMLSAIMPDSKLVEIPVR